MKAFRIDPVERTVEAIEIHNTGDIAEVIGFDSIISDEVGPNGDRLFLDEDCFIRGSMGRFRIDQIAPVARVGVVVGGNDEGDVLRDVSQSLDDLKARLQYIHS